MSYLRSDLEAAFDYAKKNPESTLEDWFDARRKVMTQAESEYYNDISYITFRMVLNGKEYNPILFRSVANDLGSRLEHFISKITGNKEYYVLTPFPGEYYPPTSYIVSMDKFFNVDEWDDHDKFKGVKQLTSEDKNVTFMFDMHVEGDWDELDYERWESYTRSLGDKKTALCHSSYYLTAYIEKTAEYEYKPVDELLKT